MEAQEFWRVIVADESDFLTRVIALLGNNGIRYCVVGGQGVNAYAEPVVSLDLNIVIAVDQLSKAEELLRKEFRIEGFPHSLKVSAAWSDLRIEIHTEPSYAAFLAGATVREVLGIRLPVASVEDVLQGTVWAVLVPWRLQMQTRRSLGVPVDFTSYCHMKFPPIREDTLSWEQPVLDTTAGDIIDFYGPCDYDPLGREDVWRQKQELYREVHSD